MSSVVSRGMPPGAAPRIPTTARIIEVPVQRAVRARQGRTLLARAVRQRDDVVEAAVEILRDRLRPSRPPVDADLGQHADGELVDLARTRAGRDGVEILLAEAGEQRFGDLAACGVAVADEEHADRGRALGRSASGIHRCQRALEVDELELEAVEVLPLPGDLAALLFERVRERRVGCLALEAAVNEATGLGRREPEAPECEDQREPGDVRVAVLAVTVGAPNGTGEDARRLIPADAGGRDSDAACEGRDVHAPSVIPTVTAKSRELSTVRPRVPRSAPARRRVRRRGLASRQRLRRCPRRRMRRRGYPACSPARAGCRCPRRGVRPARRERAAQYLVRPDGHIGYCSGAIDLRGLERYLALGYPVPAAPPKRPAGSFEAERPACHACSRCGWPEIAS